MIKNFYSLIPIISVIHFYIKKILLIQHQYRSKILWLYLVWSCYLSVSPDNSWQNDKFGMNFKTIGNVWPVLTLLLGSPVVLYQYISSIDEHAGRFLPVRLEFVHLQARAADDHVPVHVHVCVCVRLKPRKATPLRRHRGLKWRFTRWESLQDFSTLSHLLYVIPPHSHSRSLFWISNVNERRC